MWIAFKNYYLRDTTQQKEKALAIKESCELLSKIIIFVTRHNRTENVSMFSEVVNCFQKLLSSWHDTTVCLYLIHFMLLWIAFKNYYLRDTTQLSNLKSVSIVCCELLSKIIIFVTRHNQLQYQPIPCCVVNCFQKLLSSWHDTTV